MRHSNACPIARENKVKEAHLDFISLINLFFLVLFDLNRKEKDPVNMEGTGQGLDRNPAS